MKEITKESLVKNLIQTIGIIAFITMWTQVFGQQETLVAVAGMTGLLMRLHLSLPTSFKEGILASSVGFFIFGSIASLNIIVTTPLFFVVNLVSITALMFLFGTPFQYKHYMPYILVYIFAATTPAEGFNVQTRIVSLGIMGLCLGGVYWVKHQKTRTTPPALLDTAKWQPDLMKVSLTMSLGISIVLLAQQQIHFPRAMWICMTIMSLTQMERSVSKERFKKRLLGSTLGMIGYILLFEMLIPVEFQYILVFVLTYIYSFAEDYLIQVIFITFNVLYAAQVTWPLGTAFVTRIGFILVGSALMIGALWLVERVVKRYSVPDKSI